MTSSPINRKAVRIVISQKSVETLKPESREYVAWDARVHGFGVRVQPTGRKSFVVFYRAGGGRRGVQRKLTIGVFGSITADDARSEARRVLSIVQLGGDPQGEKIGKRRDKTGAELLDRFLAERRADYKASTWKGMVGRLERNVRPVLGRIKLAELTRADIREWHGRLKARGIYEANRSLAYLSAMLSWAVELELLTINPADGIRKGGEKMRSRYLDEAELAVLGNVLRGLPADNPDAQATALAVQIALYTGCRPGEALVLRWSDYNERGGFIRVHDHKTDGRNVERFLAVSEPLRFILRGVKRRGPWIVAGRKPEQPFSYDVLGKCWRCIRQQAGLSDVRLHDLRHTAATHAATVTPSAFLIRDFLGHQHVAMASRYVERQRISIMALAEELGARLGVSLRGGIVPDSYRSEGELGRRA